MEIAKKKFIIQRGILILAVPISDTNSILTLPIKPLNINNKASQNPNS